MCGSCQKWKHIPNIEIHWPESLPIVAQVKLKSSLLRFSGSRDQQLCKLLIINKDKFVTKTGSIPVRATIDFQGFSHQCSKVVASFSRNCLRPARASRVIPRWNLRL